jgi:Ca2+-dependent lipid-binding protein
MDTIGKSEPFCVITFKGTPLTYTSKVKDNTLTSVWNEQLTFALTNARTDVLYILMKDQDVASDDAMATLDIPLADYIGKKEEDVWANLVPAKGVKKGGQLHFRIALVPIGTVTYSKTQPGFLAKREKKKKDKPKQ